MSEGFAYLPDFLKLLFPLWGRGVKSLRKSRGRSCAVRLGVPRDLFMHTGPERRFANEADRGPARRVGGKPPLLDCTRG